MEFIAHAHKSDGSYEPSFAFDGARVSPRHDAIHDEVAGVDGYLEPEDSLKLYELAYLAPGPFLEIGTYLGKSAAVVATALRDARRDVEFYSLDIAGDDLELARAALAERGLGRYVTLVHGSVHAFFRALPGFRPRFVFIDGDHSAEGVARDVAALEARVPRGALLLFHDFSDPRNEDPSNKDYGVPQAIARSWVARDCEFAGVFGVAGLFRRVRGGPDGYDDGTTRAPIGLIRLDRRRVRLLVNVARPVKRRLVRHLRQLRRG
jgi:predicted O-methyltransferase YrrM